MDEVDHKGLEALLNIILVRYTSEERYQRFKQKITKAENLRFIKGEVKIIAAGGLNFRQK